jgi:nucleoside-diphosphate-sugar epimerase/transketolase N-terminal domain/subunit/2-polyprenyl-3-methyl-5-hydroxy-6-metoxy-1,4-benzoquinol methylase
MIENTFLLTGASGFIGSVLLRRLVSSGAKVSIILRKESKTWRINDLIDKVDVYYSNLSSVSELTEIVKKINPTVIYHLATNGAYSYQENANKIIETNIIGTWNLLQASNSVEYKLFVNTGSSSEYGFKEFSMKETDIVEPSSYYAVTKCAQTLLCTHIAKQENKPIVTLRPFSVYGPYEEPTRLVPTLITSLLQNKKMNLVSPTIARDYIYIDDMVDAYLKIEELIKNSGEYFNIGTGVQTTIKQIVEKSIQISKKPGNFVWGGINNRNWDSDIWVADISKAKRLLNWEPKHSLDDGIKKTLDWSEQNNTMKKNNVACAICNIKNNYTVLYEQNYNDSDFSVEVFSARRLPDKIHYQLVKCNDCGLVRSTPAIENDVLNNLYVKSKLTYSNETDNLANTYYSSIQHILRNLSKTSKILEIGCGNGFLLEKMHNHGYKNTFGIEPSIDAVKKSPIFLKKRIINDFFRPEIFKENSFEFIFIFQTLDHIPNPNEFIEECYRILKPNGYIFAYNHDVESYTAKIFGEKSPIFDIEHTFLYSEETIKKLFKKNSFFVNSVIKPTNLVSIKHLMWLLPLPNVIKMFLLKQNNLILGSSFRLPLGNIAITAQKKLVKLELTTKQKILRRRLLEVIYNAKNSHIGSSLSVIDLISVIYDIKGKEDLFVLSNGHASAAYYTVLESHGYLKSIDLNKLGVHPDRDIKKDISVSTGSLGQGLPIALGMALANKQKIVYCIISDGEAAEGSIWEALRIYQETFPKNFKIIISVNGWGAYDPISTNLLKNRLQGFGLKVIDCDGHNYDKIIKILTTTNNEPTICFARTNSQQGVPFLSGLKAHYHSMSESDYKLAINTFL